MGVEAFELYGSVKIKEAETAQRQLGAVSTQVDKTQASMDKAGGRAEKFGGLLGGLASVVGKAGIAVATFATVWDQAMSLGKQGAAVSQTAESFEGLEKRIAGTTDLLPKLRTASRGTVDDLKLMSSTTALVSGTSGKLAKSLMGATPQLLEMAKAASKLNPTLGDTTYMYESLALGIKRGSPMILDNLGITVSIEQANRAYAASIGIAVEQLTKEQQQQALLNAVLDKGRILIEQAGGSTESAADAFARMDANIKNLTDSMKARLAPSLANAATALNLILTGGQQVEDVYRAQEQQVLKSAQGYQAYARAVLEARVRGGELTEAQKEALMQEIETGKFQEGLTRLFGVKSEAAYKASLAYDRYAGTLNRYADIEKMYAVSVEEAEAQAADARKAAVRAIEDYRDAMDRAQESARGFYVEQSGLAESLKGATNAELGRQAIEQLNASMQAGKIDTEQYKTMVEDVQLSFGLATKESLALADNIATITAAAEQGVIPADKLSEAISALKTDAKDGSVDLSKILVSQGGKDVDIKPFLDAAEAQKTKTKDLADAKGQLSDSAGLLNDKLGVYDQVLGTNKDNEEKAAKAALAYRDAVEELRKKIELLKDKTVKVTVSTLSTTASAPNQPSSTPPAQGNASGADFIVPAGYPHDSYPVRVQSGERVTVTPANRLDKGGRGSGLQVYGNMTVIVQGAGGVTADQIMAQVGA